MDFKKRVIESLGWQSLSILFQGLINIVFYVIAARLIDPESFGIFALLQVFLISIERFSDFGFGYALIQKENIVKGNINFAFYASLIISSLVFAVLIVLENWISSFFNNAFTTLMFGVISFNVIIKAFGAVPRSLIIRDLEFKKLFKVVTTSNLIGFIIIALPMAYVGFEVWALITAITATNILATIGFLFIKFHSVNISFTKNEAYDIVGYGSRITFLSIVIQLGNQIDKILLGKYFSMRTLGLYERSYYIVELPKKYFRNTLSTLMFSVFSRLQNSKDNLDKTFVKYFSLVCYIIMTISIYLYIYTWEIIILLLGEDWLSALPILKILSIYAYFKSFVILIDPLILARDALNKSIYIKMFYLFFLGFLIYLARDESIIYVTFNVSFAMVIQGLLIVWLCTKIINFNFKEFLKSQILPILLLILMISKYLIIKQYLYNKVILYYLSNIFSDILIISLLFIVLLKVNRININEIKNKIFY